MTGCSSPLPRAASLLLAGALFFGCDAEHSADDDSERELDAGEPGGSTELDAGSSGRRDDAQAAVGPQGDARSPRADAGSPSSAEPDAGGPGSDAGRGPAVPAAVCDGPVGEVPKEVRDRLKLDAFYKKHLDASGIPILSSSKPDDRSLQLACALISGLLADRDDVRRALIEAKARFVIIGKDEGTAEVPEYGYRERSQAERDQINQRARGLGGQVASCGEENMLCLPGDRYRDESICLHEFAHTISTYGVYRVDRSFEGKLKDSYESARDKGILDRTYRKENEQEYWAEGVQDYYDTNASSNPSNGVHNQVDTRTELESFDPTLYGLVEEVFPEALAWTDCHK